MQSNVGFRCSSASCSWRISRTPQRRWTLQSKFNSLRSILMQWRSFKSKGRKPSTLLSNRQKQQSPWRCSLAHLQTSLSPTSPLRKNLLQISVDFIMYSSVKKAVYSEVAFLSVIRQSKVRNILKWSEEYSLKHSAFHLNVTVMEELWRWCRVNVMKVYKSCLLSY